MSLNIIFEALSVNGIKKLRKLFWRKKTSELYFKNNLPVTSAGDKTLFNVHKK